MGTLNGGACLGNLQYHPARESYLLLLSHHEPDASIALERLPRVTLFANVFYYTEGSYTNPTLGIRGHRAR
jgi:hypothetical protein